jgi:molybdate transport system ATP-binding protein
VLSFDFKKEVGDKDFYFSGSSEDPILSVIGPSGAGKTTFARCLAGFERPDSGFISVADRTYFDSSKSLFIPVHKRGIGFVFQSRRLFPHMSVEDNILLSAKWAGRTAPINLEEILRVLEIEELLTRYPDSLSGGQAQRVEIARAVVASEHLLIMDEPLSGLDPHLARQILGCIARLPKLLNIQIIYITHHPEEALSLSQKALLINDGRIEFFGSVQAALSHPAYKGENNEI